MESSAATECAICLEVYTGTTDTRQLPCGHRFHHKCFATWHVEQYNQEQVPTCPCCRQWYIPPENEPLWQVNIKTRNEMVHFLMLNHKITPTHPGFEMRFTPPFTADDYINAYVEELLYANMTLERRKYLISYRFLPGWVSMPLTRRYDLFGPLLDVPDGTQLVVDPEIEWWDGCIYTNSANDQQSEDESTDSDEDNVVTLLPVSYDPAALFLSTISDIRLSLGSASILIHELHLRGEWTTTHTTSFRSVLRDVRHANRIVRRISQVAQMHNQ